MISNEEILNYSAFLSNRDRNHSNDIDNVNSDKKADWWTPRDNHSEIIQREISVTNIQAGVIIGLNASHIDQVKQNIRAVCLYQCQHERSQTNCVHQGNT
ncbi:unnamed protein product [Adineta ricciae]|uniref:Uncharacterized protein n=1 Tax=Adineta ricciae TaxID=249248 RepID=A0A813VQQ5_ADIRI|nr:unnamed protein product [Adineta ricciae]